MKIDNITNDQNQILVYFHINQS